MRNVEFATASGYIEKMEPQTAFPTTFPKAQLSKFFQAHPLANGKPGDILVLWPKDGQAPTFTLVETQRQVDEAKAEEMAGQQAGGFRKSRYCIIKSIGDVPTFFLLAWANLSVNREAARAHGYSSNSYGKPVLLTETFLEIKAPIPSKEQAKGLSRVLQAINSAYELVESRRKMADLSQKMLDATAAQFLSGKIDSKLAASYITSAVAPDVVLRNEASAALAPKVADSAAPQPRKPGR